MSVYDVNGNTISNYYDSSGAQKNELYDVNGQLIEPQEIIFLDNTILQTVYTNPTLNYVSEGGCIGADSNAYVCFHDAGIIVNYNLITKIENQYTFQSMAYGHANGMTFNPNTGCLYIAGMSDDGAVYVLDASTLQLVNTLYAKNQSGQAFNCWNIAYDRLAERFITMSQGIMYFFDDSFQLVSTTSYSIDAWTGTRQDIETDGHYIYCVSDNPMYIHVYGMDGVYIKSISNSNFVGEPESLMYNWETNLFYLETFPLKIVRTEFRQGYPVN